MPRPLDIGLDIDGVLYPFVKVIAEYATDVLGRDCTDQADSWDWYQQWGLSQEEFFALCGRSVRERILYTKGIPLPGALEAATALAEAGHRLHYISARAIAEVPRYLAWHRTAEWLWRWQFPVDSLTISDDKFCRPTDVFLDDAPHTYEALVAAGHPRPVLWCHSETQTTPDVVGVHSWDQFLALVEQTAGGGSVAVAVAAAPSPGS